MCRRYRSTIHTGRACVSRTLVRTFRHTVSSAPRIRSNGAHIEWQDACRVLSPRSRAARATRSWGTPSRNHINSWKVTISCCRTGARIPGYLTVLGRGFGQAESNRTNDRPHLENESKSALTPLRSPSGSSPVALVPCCVVFFRSIHPLPRKRP